MASMHCHSLIIEAMLVTILDMSSEYVGLSNQNAPWLKMASASPAHLESNHTLWKAMPCSASGHLPAFLLSESLLESGLGRGQVACWIDHVDCRGYVYCCCCMNSLAGSICWTADLSGCNSSRTCQRGASVYPAKTNTVAIDS